MPLLHKSLIALALAGILALPLLRLDADASAPAAEAPPAMVSVAPAVRTDFAPRHWAPGSIISRRDARVASELEGRVLQVAEVGQHVRAGQALAVLDDTALRLRERESEAELARTEYSGCWGSQVVSITPWSSIMLSDSRRESVAVTWYGGANTVNAPKSPCPVRKLYVASSPRQVLP